LDVCISPLLIFTVGTKCRLCVCVEREGERKRWDGVGRERERERNFILLLFVTNISYPDSLLFSYLFLLIVCLLHSIV
jgi:hypothetical protein